MSETQQLTPMMRQYYDLKQRAGDSIMFFRMGDFYEIFGSDAEEVAPKLQLALTSREKGDAERIPFCGVPHHSARNYWLKLLRMGYKVAIADQMEDPAAAKGIVKRDITRFFTPACIDDLDGLDENSPNYLAAIFEDPKTKGWSIAIADYSTGELRLGSLANLDEAVEAIFTFRPKEVLVRKFFLADLKGVLASYTSENPLRFEILSEDALRTTDTNWLQDQFGKSSMDELPCGQFAGALPLATAIFAHFKSLQMATAQFLTIRPLVESQRMNLDETARRDLELFETSRRRQSEGSLFWEINRCLTSMGARSLRSLLQSPFTDEKEITARLGAVEFLKSALLVIAEKTPLLSQLRLNLKNLPDLERLATRVSVGSASPMDLGAIRTGLRKADQVASILRQSSGTLPKTLLSLCQKLTAARDVMQLLQDALVDAPQACGQGIGVFRTGHDSELDDRASLARDGSSCVEAYEAKLREKTGISSLKVRSHKSFGLLIEVTKTNLSKVPKEFVRRQTMVNCERYITAELQDLDQTLANATEQAVTREFELFEELRRKIATEQKKIYDVATAIAGLDCLQSLAFKAEEAKYCKPTISGDGSLDLKAARHPVIESIVGTHQFTPNSLLLSPKEKTALITGPNMAGKSTVMRQTAICALLHQIGSYVPADQAELPIFDRVFTRVGASDDLVRGQSTFMVEMVETANILRHATAKSLVILDEVGRGTSTKDGIAIATAVLEAMVKQNNCYTLFATHYHEMLPFAAELTGVKFFQTEVRQESKRVVFTHRLLEGCCSSSFGLEVARLAGVPEGVVKRAQKLHGSYADEVSPPSKVSEIVETVVDQRFLDIIARLERVVIHRTTPLQALNILNDLKSGMNAPEERDLFAEHH